MNLKNGATVLKTVSQGMKKMAQKMCTKNSTAQKEGGRGLKIFLEVVWVTGFIGKLWSDSRVKIEALKFSTLFAISGTQTVRGRPGPPFFLTLNEPSLIDLIQRCTVIKCGAESAPNTF